MKMKLNQKRNQIPKVKVSRISKNPGSKRFREILKVLKRHHLMRGLTPIKVRETVEDLGPTFVKLGQIMSMRSDMIPQEYCHELCRLRTQVKPFPFEDVMTILQSQLGHDPYCDFECIDQLPLASASIAQVHIAYLKTGEKVVIKVQRPNIKETMAEDIKLLKKAVGIIKLTAGTEDLIDFNSILDELWATSQQEMDFLKESYNLTLFYNNQKDIKYITCPRVIPELTTPQILTMEYIGGIQIDDIDKLTELDYDMNEIGEKAAENYCKQILDDGFFHADPHPGNIWISNGCIAWLDLGMIGYITPHTQQFLRNAITAILENDIYSLKNIFLAFGESKGRIDHTKLYSDIDQIVSKYINIDFGSIHLGDLVERMLDLVRDHEIAIPTDITMLARSMVTIEGTLAVCAPKVNLLRILSNHMSNILFKEMDAKKIARHIGVSVYTSLDKSLSIPAQLSDLLNISKNGQLRLNLDYPNMRPFLYRLDQRINKILIVVIASVLFLGGCLLCLTDRMNTIAGIPWIAFFCFIISGLMYGLVLIKILISRRRKKRIYKKI